MLDSVYTLELPELPQAWEAMLGSPLWRIEWIDNEGRTEKMTIRAQRVEISLPPTLASAVIAWPFWPENDLGPGIFRPAGAIFPFDASGKSLILSWQGGIDAYLYGEFIKLAAEAGREPVLPEEPESEQRAAVPRLPWNFDWPRFRLLFDDPTVNAQVRADPWCADWSGIAAKIVQSGFDKRRLVPEARGSLNIPADSGISLGPWIGTSPFAAPLIFETEAVFPVRASADTWVCAEGIARGNTQTWIIILYNKEI